jgi:hypothetical protein
MGRVGPSQTSEQNKAEALLEKMAENDTRAYLEAEQALTEQQQAKAREIASEYREALWDSQHPKPPK